MKTPATGARNHPIPRHKNLQRTPTALGGFMHKTVFYMTLEEQLERDEGNVPYAYQDSLGYWSIGIGFLIDKRKGGQLYPEEIMFILTNRLKFLRAKLKTEWPWFSDLDNARQDALLNMAYNMGFAGLGGFKKMLAAMEQQDYAEAAKEMMDSKWATQVGDRAKRLQQQILTGEYV